MQFCLRMEKNLNPEKDFREEKFLIFSSIIQIKNFMESEKIFIDLNYNICPKGYSQLMSILSYNPKNNLFMPCFFIPMSFKTFISYDYAFKSILELIDDNELIYDNKNKNFVLQADIDSNLIKAFKENFQKTEAYGSYFNYLKKI